MIYAPAQSFMRENPTSFSLLRYSRGGLGRGLSAKEISNAVALTYAPWAAVKAELTAGQFTTFHQALTYSGRAFLYFR